MVVIKGNRLHAVGSPADLFRDPPDKYVASLFDDVNEMILKGEKVLLYPNQIRIVPYSEVKARVLRSYYKGTHWLVEMDFEGQVIFVNHPEELPPEKEVSLEFLCH
jgi:ABC-type Fe3+/spermidine/putrescine transport system ATPase subunit